MDNNNFNSRNTEGGIKYNNNPLLNFKSQGHVSIAQLNKNLSNINNELKEQIRKLNDKIERDKYEILLLKQTIKTRNRKIENLTEQVNNYKKENIELTQQKEILEKNYQTLLDSRNSEINAKDLEISDLIEKIRRLKTDGDENDNAEYYGAHQKYGIYSNGRIVKSQNNLNEYSRQKKSEYYEPRSDSPIEKTYTWVIDDIHNKREIGEPLKSEYFYVRMNPYKFQLVLVNYGTTLKIRLLIYATESDSQLNWPLNTDVMIKIVNNNSPGNYERSRETRLFERPKPNSFISSKEFVFSYLDLFTSRLLEWDTFIIECYIAIK